MLALYFYPDVPTAGALFKDACYRMLADGWSIAEYIPTIYYKWADMEFAREVYNLALSQKAFLTKTQAEIFWRRASFYTWTEIASDLDKDISNVRSYYFAALVRFHRVGGIEAPPRKKLR